VFLVAGLDNRREGDSDEDFDIEELLKQAEV